MDSFASASVQEFASRRYDFIVVGGGTAGLAVATRLAENTALTVGLLEAGGIVGSQDDIDIPAFYGRSLGGQHDWRFETEPQQALGGRTLPWPRGKVLGGTSALNFMAWNRASREDYDAWEALGNPGWGWDSLLPFFKKCETFHPPSESLHKEYNVSHDPEFFGKAGPIQVSYSTEYSPSHQLWHNTLNALGVKTNPAHFAGSNVGVWTSVNSVDPRTASRSYATSYLSSLGSTSNLHVLTEATVQKIVLEKDGFGKFEASGVCFLHQGQEHIVSASREVIISAGSIKSPQILELSGIGNRDVLIDAGIPVIIDSPRVGENLQDHIMIASIFEVDPGLANPDDLKRDEATAAAALDNYSLDRTGRLTILPCSLCYIPLAHVLSSKSLTALHSKACDLPLFDVDKGAIQNKRLDGHAKLGQIEYLFDLGNWNPHYKGEDGKNYGTMLQMLQYPFSVGSIHVKPSHDGVRTSAEDSPLINPEYYAGSHGQLDLGVMKECMRFARNITKTKPLADIVRGPASPSTATLEDDRKLEQWISENTITDWHPVGTCGMSGRGGIRTGVVDERLRVHGVKGVRVVDASVMPLQISAHLQATVYAIAEKAAHMILEDVAERGAAV